jgi:hypothetical protein
MPHIPKINQADLINPDPLSILQKIKQFILGKENPDKLTQIMFFFNLLLWSTFFIWSISGYFALHYANHLAASKKLLEIIDLRAEELGIPHLFKHYKSFLFYTIFSWASVLFGLILLWRKRFSYVFFYFGGLICYPIFMWWFLNIKFMVEDVSRLDKVSFALLFAPMAIYHLFFTKEKEDEKLEQIDTNEALQD